jgi:hypothetical protein
VKEYAQVAREAGFQKVWEHKHAVARAIHDYVADGGFLFAMCSATDSLDVDRFDMAWFAGNGCSNCTVSGCPKAQRHCLALGTPGRIYASPSEPIKLARLGNAKAASEFSEDLEWIGFSTPAFLTPYSYDLPCEGCGGGEKTRNSWPQDWSEVFDGLHGALGFATTAYPNQEEVIKDFVVYSAYPLSWGSLYPVRQAFFEAVLDNWERGIKRCGRSTRNASCNRSCASGGSHCCPVDSVYEATYHPGLAGALAIEQNANEVLDDMRSDCYAGDESCHRLAAYWMTGHQACEVWNDD